MSISKQCLKGQNIHIKGSFKSQNVYIKGKNLLFYMVKNQNFSFSKNRQKSRQIFGDFGQKNCRQKPPKIAKMATNRHIWSHWATTPQSNEQPVLPETVLPGFFEQVLDPTFLGTRFTK